MADQKPTAALPNRRELLSLLPPPVVRYLEDLERRQAELEARIQQLEQP